MTLDLMNIINNKLYKSNYIAASFFVVFFYTYYRLFIYLQDKNYIMLILYFSLLLVLYNNFKKFSYIICFIALILIQIFNIDNLLNIFVKNYNNKIIENLDSENDVQVGTTMDTIQKRSDAKGATLENNAEDAKSSDTKSNPCENYISKRLIESGIKVSTKSYNMDDAKDNTAEQLSETMPKERLNIPEPGILL